VTAPGDAAAGSGLTVRAVAVGALLGVLLAASGLYVAHKVAGNDAGHLPAVIVGFALLSALARGRPGRRPDPRETNIVQTIASSAAMMTITGGFIGPATALVLAGQEPSLVALAAWGAALGVAGSLIAVPLHGAFVALGALPFPSALATAHTIEAVHAEDGGARGSLRALGIGAAIAAAIVIAQGILHWIPQLWMPPLTLGAVPAHAIYLGIGWSPMLAGVGVLAGPRPGAALALGSVVAWVVLAPWLVGAGVVAEAAYVPLVTWLLWPGLGLMIGGALAGLASGGAQLAAGLRALRGGPGAGGAGGAGGVGGAGGAGGAGGLRFSRAHAIALAGAVLAVVVLGRIAFGLSPALALLALLLSLLVCPAAARAKGETDRAPAGPLATIGQLVVGAAAPGSIGAPLGGGGILNGAAMQSTTLLNNWRVGRRLGAPPGPQLVASIVGVAVGAIAVAAAFELIRRAYGLGNAIMPVPAGQSWKATAELVQHGLSAMPRGAPLAAGIGLGAGAALALAARHRRLGFLPSPVALGMAFITPPYVSITIALAGLIPRGTRPDGARIPLAAGAIAGEAIAGLATAAWMLATD
jgi:uncharacterized oligopeptide transporter (OPT) family protein